MRLIVLQVLLIGLTVAQPSGPAGFDRQPPPAARPGAPPLVPIRPVPQRPLQGRQRLVYPPRGFTIRQAIDFLLLKDYMNARPRLYLESIFRVFRADFSDFETDPLDETSWSFQPLCRMLSDLGLMPWRYVWSVDGGCRSVEAEWRRYRQAGPDPRPRIHEKVNFRATPFADLFPGGRRTFNTLVEHVRQTARTYQPGAVTQPTAGRARLLVAIGMTLHQDFRLLMRLAAVQRPRPPNAAPSGRQVAPRSGPDAHLLRDSSMTAAPFMTLLLVVVGVVALVLLLLLSGAAVYYHRRGGRGRAVGGEGGATGDTNPATNNQSD